MFDINREWCNYSLVHHEMIAKVAMCLSDQVFAIILRWTAKQLHWSVCESGRRLAIILRWTTK